MRRRRPLCLQENALLCAHDEVDVDRTVVHTHLSQLLMAQFCSVPDTHRISLAEREVRGVVLVEERLVPDQVLASDEARLGNESHLSQADDIDPRLADLKALLS